MIARLSVARVLIVEALALVGALLIVADFRAHRASEQLGGVNIWGYRGPVMLRKASNETRIVVVGGGLAFGWGVAASETLAPGLRLLASVALDRPGGEARRITAVNLGALGLPASRYAARIDQYRDLQPDVICLVVDPPGGGSRWATLPREESAILAATGYVPMLPLVLIDKGTSRQSGALALTGRLLQGTDAALHAVFFAWFRPQSSESDADAVANAVRTALTIARGVVVVAPPYASGGGDVTRHMALLATIQTTFPDERRLRVVDLGDVPELADPGLRLEGGSFSAGGHAKVAEQVSPAVLELIR